MTSFVLTTLVVICVLAPLTEAYGPMENCPDVDSLLCDERCEAKDMWKSTIIILDNGKECQGCPICTEPRLFVGGCPYMIPCSSKPILARCKRLNWFHNVEVEVNGERCPTWCPALEC